MQQIDHNLSKNLYKSLVIKYIKDPLYHQNLQKRMKKFRIYP